MNPKYEVREHGRFSDAALGRYILSAAEDITITASTSSTLRFNIKWPAQLPQYFAVFGLNTVNKVSDGKNDLVQSKSLRPAANEWYFIKGSNILLVNLQRNANNFSISIDASPAARTAETKPAPAKPATVKEPQKEENEKEEPKKEVKELSPEEKKKQEKQRREEEKKQEEQRKKDEEKRKQEEKKKKKQEQNKK